MTIVAVVKNGDVIETAPTLVLFSFNKLGKKPFRTVLMSRRIIKMVQRFFFPMPHT